MRHLKKEKNLDELSKSLQWHQQFFLILKKRYIYYRDVNFWKFKILRLSHLLQLTVPPISTHLIPETHQSIQSSNHYRLYIVCGCGSRHYCGIRGTSNIEVNLCFLRVLLRWLMAVKDANASWLLNFRVHMCLKSTLKNWFSGTASEN